MSQLVVQYDSDSGSDGGERPAAETGLVLSKKPRVEAAPDVNTEDLGTFRFLPSVSTREITHNVPYADLARPLAGPTNPFQSEAVGKNILTGFVEEHAMSDLTFSTMERTYMNYGYTVNPNSQNELIGNAEKIAQYGGATIHEIKADPSTKRKRKPKGDPSVVGGYKGPWA
ncbi:hypothetical protein BC830DRAFT_1174038, partial [Chytriomyces sp. MP71]